MIKSKKLFCKILSATVVLGVLFSNVTNISPKAINLKDAISNVNVLTNDSTTNISSVSSNDYNLPDEVEGGVILHAWCWSTKTIISQLPDIAAAGYTAIQTSPCNGILGGKGTDIGKWWTQYQPTSLTVGNYMVGSKEEFTELCTKAHEYGIKIIVDVVPNHTSGDRGFVADNLKPYWRRSDYTIDIGSVSDGYNNRYSCTQYDVCNGGLPDLNTEDKNYQNLFISYLNELISCGCDGFRYDTAKHIAVPEDSASNCGSDFWPTVTSSAVTDINKKIVYAEVLQDKNVMFDSYAKYVHLTGNSYSAVIRDKLRNDGTMDVNSISNYCVGDVSKDRLVTWAESHDTYANNPNDDKYGNSMWATEDNIKMVWAFITARKETTTLFYARPANGSWDYGANELRGSNGICEMGSTAFKSPEVAAVNNFRNAMIGESEYLRNPNGNTKIAMVERGKKGVVIINLGGATDLSSETTLADGTYTDQVSGRDFTVSGGKISGHLDEYKVAVVYNATDTKAAKVSASVATGTSFTDSLKVTLNAKNTTSAKYSVDGGSEESFTDGKSITIGADTKVGGTVTLKLTGTGESGDVSETYTYTKKDPNAVQYAYLKMPSSWSGTPKAYIYDATTDKSDDKWPGTTMTNVEGDTYRIEVPTNYSKPAVIFYASETNRYPEDQKPGLDLSSGSSMIYDGTSWKEYITSGGEDDPVEDIKAGKISFSVSSPQEEGTSVKITTAAATGGSGDYSYQFECDDEIIQEYSSYKTATWKPDKEGNYTIKVTVKDSEGNTDSKTATYKITSKSTEEPDENEYTITVKYIDKDTGKAICSEEKITGKEGESYKIVKKSIDGYTFKSYIGDLSGTFSEDATVTLKYVKEASSNDDNNNDNEEIVIDLFEATTSKTNIEPGTTIKFNVSASGGSGTLQYALMCIKDGNVETIKDYSTKTSFTWTPEEEGTYKLYVMVKDDNETTTKSNKITYTVNNENTSQDPKDTSDASNVGLIISVLALAGISMKKFKK